MPCPTQIYMVTSGTHYNTGCCFDYGNSEVRGCGYPGARPCGASEPAVASPDADPKCPGCGLMEAIAWGAQGNGPTHKGNRANHPGSGAGPWVMADLESGVRTGQGGGRGKGGECWLCPW